MDKLIQKFIVWYLKRNNVKFDCGKYIVRMFSADYYSSLMNMIELIKEIDRHPEKVTATPIKEKTEYGDRIIGWKYRIIVMMDGGLSDENE